MSSQTAKPRFITRIWVSCLVVLLAWLLNQQFFLWPPERIVGIDAPLLTTPASDSDEWVPHVVARFVIYWLVRHPIGMLINMLVIANSLLSMRAVLPKWYWKWCAGLVAIGIVCSVLFGSITVLTASLALVIVVLVLAMLPGARYYYVDSKTGAYQGEAHDMNSAQWHTRDEMIGGLLITYVPLIMLGLLTHVITFEGVFH